VRRAALACALQGVLVALALALTGCETTAEKSARLERQAKLAANGSLSQKGLSITRESAVVSVVRTTVVHSSEGAVAFVTLRNSSAHALSGVPIAITVKDAGGRTLSRNDAPGLQPSLVSVGSLPARGELTWVDDQVPPGGAPASVVARVGEAAAVGASLPRIAVQGLHQIEDPSNGLGAAGTVRNGSRIAQRSLVVFVTATRAGKIVAGARAVLPEVAAGASMPFQVFFIGDPSGAGLHASAPPTTFG
jgi:hypothetical protein